MNTPLYDPRIEMGLTAAFLRSPDVALRMQMQPATPFFSEPFRTVIAVSERMRAESRYVDPATLYSELGGRALPLAGPTGTSFSMDSGQFLNALWAEDISAERMRAYLGAFWLNVPSMRAGSIRASLEALLRATRDDPDEMLSEIEKLLEYHTSAHGVTADNNTPELLQAIAFIRELESRQRGGDYTGLDSGFKHLNNLINGLDLGLTVLAGPPGSGKTTLAVQTATQAAEINPAPVIVISYEQSAHELRVKTLSRLSKVGYREILRGRLVSGQGASEWGQVLQAAVRYAVLGRRLTIIEGSARTTVQAVEALARRQMQATNADRCLLVFDYLQIIPVDGESARLLKSTKDRIDFQVSELRRLARALRSPVLCLSSQNRAGYEKRSLGSFKESGGIEYGVDVAAILTTPQTDDPEPEANYRRVDLNVIKNRNGERGVVEFKFYPQRCDFVELNKRPLQEEGT